MITHCFVSFVFGLLWLKLLLVPVLVAVAPVIVEVGANLPKLAKEQDEDECADETKDGTEGRPEDAEDVQDGFEDGVDHGIVLFGIMCIVPSYARNVSRLQH